MSFLEGYARKLGVLEYKGVWNSATNTPALTSSVGTRGAYYVVSVGSSGVTTLDGISEFSVGDWIIFEGVWQRINTADSEQVDIAKLQAIHTDTKEPTGHIDTTQSVIAFNESTRVFSISPVSTSYAIYVKGTKITISSTLSVTLPNTSGSYFIYIDQNGSLQYQTTFDASILSDKAYTGYVYWNATDGVAVSYGEERHGIVLDASSHGYLHTTRGTQLVSGASIGYTTTGNGTLAADAQVSIGDSSVRDEDILAQIRHSATPTSNFQQILSPIAELPIIYKSGTTWTRISATQYPIKFGTTRAQYNLNTGGTWSLQDASADNKFLVSYIFVSTNVHWPVFALLGQDEYSSLADAQARASWSQVNFGDLPAQEFKLCYILIYETSSTFTNAVKSAIRYAVDVRFGVDRELSALSQNTAHSNLSGLSGDDHTQYLLVSGARAMAGALDMGTHHIDNVVDPTSNQQAATKKYVDDGLATKQPTGNYITALTGDVSASGPGSATATLSNTGVAAGTYNLVTVDAKGRVTAGTTGSTARFTYSNANAVASTSVTYAGVTGLLSTTLQPGLYYFRFTGLMQSANANTGVGVRVGPATATVSTMYAKWMLSQTGNGTSQSFQYDQLTSATNVTSASVPTANTNFVVTGEGTFRVTVAGTVEIETRSETAGAAVTLQPDASFVIELM